jgi:hypothetical protein
LLSAKLYSYGIALAPLRHPPDVSSPPPIANLLQGFPSFSAFRRRSQGSATKSKAGGLMTSAKKFSLLSFPFLSVVLLCGTWVAAQHAPATGSAPPSGQATPGQTSPSAPPTGNTGQPPTGSAGQPPTGNTGQPPTGNPGNAQPGTTNPNNPNGSTSPNGTPESPSHPNTAPNGSTNPDSANPGSTNPGSTNPGSTNPGTPNPVSANPGTSPSGPGR